jgi:Ser-tRNA(Ala) deacylase AlaX
MCMYIQVTFFITYQKKKMCMHGICHIMYAIHMYTYIYINTNMQKHA